MPAGQGISFVPPGQYLPTVHAAQAAAPVENVPAAHAEHTFAPAAAYEPAGQAVHVPATVWLKYCPAGHEMVPEREIPVALTPPSLNDCNELPCAPNAKQTKAPLFIDGGAVKVYVVGDVTKLAVGFPEAAATHPTVGGML